MADFLSQQRHFAQAVRTDSAQLPSGVSADQMQVYRELCRNNVFSFIDAAFPVCREVVRDTNWLQLKKDYFSTAAAESPFFYRISAQFLDWLEQQNNQPAWLKELARYEWAELKADTEDEFCAYVPCPDQPDAEHLWEQQAVISNTVTLGLFAYPVHEISATNPPSECRETPLVIYRDNKDQVHFLLLNTLSFALLDAIRDQPLALGELIVQCLQQHDQMSSVAVQGALNQVQDWWRQGLIRQFRSI